MKTIIITISVLFQLVAFNASSANTTQTITPFLVHTDSYIDDIPFDTEKVVQDYYKSLFCANIIDITAYIDDIPFDTEEVVAAVKANEAMQVRFEMQAEAQIEDIPFDTEKIATQAIESKIYQMQFDRMSK
ncbi:MAG: hypothetical protein K8F24_12060 [Bacteroidales bacterium]|nr:hypothetical protein [Bacteroidales bacterium]